MKGSDLFLRSLESEGVEVIFGVPGEENVDFMISLLVLNRGAPRPDAPSKGSNA